MDSVAISRIFTSWGANANDDKTLYILFLWQITSWVSPRVLFTCICTSVLWLHLQHIESQKEDLKCRLLPHMCCCLLHSWCKIISCSAPDHILMEADGLFGDNLTIF